MSPGAMEVPACFAPGGTQNSEISQRPSCHWDVAPACGDLSGGSWQGLQMSACTSAGFPRIKGSRSPSANPSAGSPVRRGEELPWQGAGGLRGWEAPLTAVRPCQLPSALSASSGGRRGKGSPLKEELGKS